MPKDNTITKHLKKLFLSINNSIQSYFNKIENLKTFFKKTKFNTNSKAFFVLGIIFIVILTYFSLPSFYNKSTIKSEIKNQFLIKYKIDIKFNQKISYGLFPKPHFATKNLSILHEQKKIGEADNLKVFIKINKFFNINQIEIKDLVLKKVDFNIYKKDILFFKKLLETEPNENEIIIKESNIFFKNKYDEVLFLNKIYKSKFYYDSKNLQNVLSLNNEIFNVPFKFVVRNDKFNKKIFTKFNAKKIRLSIENNIDYSKNIKKGLLDILFINNNTSFKYELSKDSLYFISGDKKNYYKGLIDFKPFYFSANFDYEGLSSRNIFNQDAILFDVIQSEILNNKNLNANINLAVKNITNIDELNSLFLKININQGDIEFSNSNMMWKDDVKIKLKESLLVFDNNEINLIGKIILDFDNIDDFYKSFQINKRNRKILKQIKIDFIYNFNQNRINFDNVKIDGNSNLNLEKYISNYNSKNDSIFNRITFKNFVNNFFKSYSG